MNRRLIDRPSTDLLRGWKKGCLRPIWCRAGPLDIALFFAAATRLRASERGVVVVAYVHVCVSITRRRLATSESKSESQPLMLNQIRNTRYRRSACSIGLGHSLWWSSCPERSKNDDDDDDGAISRLLDM